MKTLTAVTPRRLLEQELAAAQRRLTGIPLETRVSADDIDRVVAQEQHELDARTQEALLRRVRSMRRALDRVAEGTYGTCTECGQGIPRRRLELVPDAERCVACAEIAERDEKGRRA